MLPSSTTSSSSTTTTSSSTSRSSRSSSCRSSVSSHNNNTRRTIVCVVIFAILFFIGLQFRNLHYLFRTNNDNKLHSSFFVTKNSHHHHHHADTIIDGDLGGSSVLLDVPWGPMIDNNSNNNVVAGDEESKDSSRSSSSQDNDNRTKQKTKKRTTTIPTTTTTTTEKERMVEPTDYDTTVDDDDEEEEDPATEEEELGRIRIYNKQQQQQERKKTITAQDYINMDPLSWTLPQPTYPIHNQTSEEFMLHYIAIKRRYNISLPWEKKINDDNNDNHYNDDIYNTTTTTNLHQVVVPLPRPIISLNFPKSATLTMSAYFDCAGLTSIHTSTQNGRIALCMLTNQLYNHPPMYNCNVHHVKRRHTNTNKDSSVGVRRLPIDFFSDIGLQGPPCYYASLHDGGLENILRHYPNATLLLVTRDATSWYHSMVKWGGIMGRWKKYCGFGGQLHTTTTNTTNNHSTNDMEYWKNMYNEIGLSREKEEMYWINFYNAHTQKIREFVLQHLSLTYIEVEIENPNIGSILHHYTKVSPECVLYCHPGPHWIKKHDTINKCHPVGQEPALLKEGEIWPGY